jgi:hypothetical protein
VETVRALPSIPDWREVVCEAARAYANRLGLRNHTIEVVDDPPHDPRALAEVQMALGRDHIRLRLSEFFPAASEEEQRHALAHELMHPHMHRLTERTIDAFQEHIGGVAYRIWLAGFRDDVEEVVDRMASMVEQLLPSIAQIRDELLADAQRSTTLGRDA